MEKERKRMDSELKRKKTMQRSNPCTRDRTGICESVPIIFRIGDSLYSSLRTERQRLRASIDIPTYTYVSEKREI